MALPLRHPAGPAEVPLDAALMVDVLLVLLLFLLLGQAFVGQVRSADTAPVAATAPVVPIADPVVLDVTGAGVLVNGQPVPTARLRPELGTIYARRASKILFVRLAADRRPGQVARALHAAQLAGVTATALLPAGP